MTSTDHERRLTMDALDIQTDLFRFFGKTNIGARFVISLFQQALPEKQVERYAAEIVAGVMTSPVYAVTSEIVDVISSASLTLPSFDMQPHDMPSQHGFIWLESPIVIPDIHGKNVVFRAFGWITANFALVDDDDDEPSERGDGAFFVGFTDPSDPRDHLHDAATTGYIASPRGLLPMLSGLHSFSNPEWIESTDGLGVVKWFMAFSRFVGETWVDHRVVEPGRPALKRAARVRTGEPEVSIVQLRRRAQSHAAAPEGVTPQEWSHRWLVRGHWRNQWYPSLQVHRPKWIPEHIKGPDDKPLIVREKIFSVSR